MLNREREEYFCGGTFFSDRVLNILRMFHMRGTKYARIDFVMVHISGGEKYPITPDHVSRCQGLLRT